MTFITTSLGLTVKTPSQGDRNWAAQFLTDFVQKISSHDHTGSGRGLQLGTNAILNGAITPAKLSSGAQIFVNVKTYGATGDGTTDDTAAIQSAINAVRSAGGGVVFFPQGTYIVSISLNFTGMVGFEVWGSGLGGTTIRLNTAGTPGIDLTGSRNYSFRNMLIFAGSGTNSPNVVILKARNNTLASVGLSEFNNVQIESPNSGTTCKAVVYSYASEDDSYVKCNLYTHVASTPALYITSKNDLSVTSLYQTIATGEQSNTVVNFTSGSILDTSAGSGATSAYPVYLHNARDITFFNSSMVANGDAFFYLLSDGPSNLVDELNVIGVRFEPGSANPLYVFKGDATNTTVILGVISGNIFNASTAIYKQLGGTGTITQLGEFSSNNTNGSAPAYLINTTGDIQGGQVDCMNMQVTGHNIFGTVFRNARHVADVVNTAGACGYVVISNSEGGSPESLMKLAGNMNLSLSLPVYANNAAAITGGLVAGMLYRTGANPDPVCIVH
jgi:hypothetical protein